MNIDRVAPGAAAVGARRPSAPSKAVDLTVSDRGVEDNQPPVGPPRQGVPAVASNAQLQEVLSAAETRALHEAFFSAPAAGGNPPARPAGLYTLRGHFARAAGQVVSGALLDVTG